MAGDSTPSISDLGPPDQDTIRILVSTDNHLGYLERDPVRGLDSFAALEEVLYLAKKYESDMVLLAGDLFHDNKPTRRTLHKTMEIIKRYTMGPNPVRIQILSEDNFAHGEANYLQEFYSVDLPIFSIHGNHDDPTRDGNELLAALDLLSVSSLVNYFGRQDAVDKVEISPILLKKGETHVALFGMGSLRDERLNRMWQSKKVRFQRPGEGDWFNIFALHQNRDLGRGSKNCVHETMIPEWMDLIVWGHEHECLIEPSESVVGTFRISQPGSSVATSLSAGESIRKHVGFLDIRDNQFRMTPCPLIQVRSFMMGEVGLSGRGLDPDDAKIDDKVGELLEQEVKLLMHEARAKRKELLMDAKEQGNDPDEQEGLEYKLQHPDHHLVRLKVEHSGFTTLNNQRFGARFVNRVANPAEILLFHRRKETGERASVKRKKSSKLDKPIAPDVQDEMKIEDLIKENLDISDKKLEVLDEIKLTIALEEFVDKEMKQAMADATKSMLAKQQKRLLEPRNEKPEEDDENVDQDMEEDEVEVVEEVTPKPKKRTARSKSSRDIEEDEDEEEIPKPKRAATTRKRATTKRKAQVEEDDEDSFEEPAPPRSRGRPKRSTKAKAKYVEDSDEDANDDDVIEESEEEVVKPKKRGNARTTASSRRKRGGSQHVDSDDEDFGNSYGVDDDWGEANTNTEK